MPQQGRVGDRSDIPANTHGRPCCPHHCIGPAIAGSPNVVVNQRAALRIGDPGIHAQCCDSNTWVAKTGSGTVVINNIPAHRLGDLDQHCGGIGVLIEGSPNVIVGG